MPRCYGYTLGDPKPLEQYHQDHLASWTFAGCFRDDKRSLSIRARPEGKKLFHLLSQGDCLLLPNFRVFRNVTEMLEVTLSWGRQGIVIVSIEDEVHLCNSDPAGLNALRFARAVICVPRAHQVTSHGRAPQDTKFLGYGTRRARVNGRWTSVYDPPVVAALDQLVAFHDAGWRSCEIASWLNSERMRRRKVNTRRLGKKLAAWSTQTVAVGYRRAMELREFRAGSKPPETVITDHADHAADVAAAVPSGVA